MQNIGSAYYRATLAGQELAGIRRLRDEGAKRGVAYKIDPGTDSGIVYFADSRLAGFMTVDCFGGGEVEAAAIAGSAAAWDAMAAVLFARAREQAASRVLFICDPRDEVMVQVLHAKGLAPAFSEYRMEWNAACFAPVPAGDVSLRPATRADEVYLLALDGDAFGGEGPMAPGDLKNTQIILHSGQPAGKVRVEAAEGVCGIYGLVVEEHLRGRGIGGRAMSLVLGGLSDSSAQTVYLEVDSENPAAFHLYQKLGFKTVSTFCYYPYPL